MPARPSRRRVALPVVLALVATCLAGFASAAQAQASWVVSGTVTSGGQPLRTGWPLIVVDELLADGSRRDVGEFEPADDGTYSFALPMGQYLLYTYASPDYQGEWYDDALRVTDATPVVVAGADVTLQPIDLAPPAVITGLVVDGDGTPIVGAGVGAYEEADDESLREFERTDEDGRFVLEVGADDWYVKVSGPGGGYVSEWYDDAVDPGDARVVPVRRDDVDLGTIALAPGGQISGTVTWDERVQGTRVDVVLYDLEGTRLASLPVDQGSRYSFGRLLPGRYVVGFEDQGGELDPDGRTDERLLREFHPDEHSWSSAQSIEVSAGTMTSGVDAHLEARPDPDPSTIEISGTLTDQSGAPLAGMTVSALSSATDRHQPVIRASARTDVAGHYELDDLDPAPDTSRDYVLLFAHRLGDGPQESATDVLGPVMQWTPGVEQYEDRTPVTIPDEGTLVADATLRRRSTIEVVATPATDDLDTGVVMTVVDLAGEEVAATSNWSLDTAAELRITGLPPDPYYLRFTGDAIPTTWWPGVPDIEHATPVTAPAGRVTEGMSIVLGDPTPPVAPVGTLRSVTAPQIVGRPVIGGMLSVDPGTWNLDPVEHDVLWLSEGRVVGRGRHLALRTELAGRLVTARVTSTHVASDQRLTTVVGPLRIPRLTSTTTARARTPRRGLALVQIIAFIKVEGAARRPAGVLVLLEHGRVMARQSAGARRALVPARTRPGRHVYVVRYRGSDEIAPSETTVVVRVPKRPAGRAAS